MTGGPPIAKYDCLTAIRYQFVTYAVAASTAPRRPATSVGCHTSQTTDTVASIVNSAGSSRRARRIQNALRSVVPVRTRSPISSDVIRYPLMTKNTSTPRKPPGIHDTGQW